MSKGRGGLSPSWTAEQAQAWAGVVRDRMAELGIRTQAALAEQVGVSPLSVAYWLRGARRPSVEAVVAVADALYLDENMLLGLAGHKTIAPADDPERDEVHRLVDAVPAGEIAEVRSYLLWRQAERRRREREAQASEGA